ncbi:hypothetical protein KUCAC02_012798 [Chaenocephalus aceratus]|uniref:Uncharacterized protein n=1 Tax=Chaenocephalus aceratus TaxID=36190 RepID=A0ACB9XDN9_CHAAC|nr:hypothetical protein KUCAC02_012798 [Chaenocephalus aceratus]
MPKNTKVTQREHSNEPVTESVADLLSLEHPMDYKNSQMSMGLSPGSTAPVKALIPSPDPDAEDGRPAWNNKLEYILAQVGFSVGLGNVWRFPYLCQKNGGGAYLVPYFILLILIGIPLFFLELAVGQRIRRGSIGVWNYVYPQLGGIGVSSLMLGWPSTSSYRAALLLKSVGWDDPADSTLNITSSIDDTGGLNWKMVLSLLVAWILVCLAVIKGIQSSGKVMYFSSLFPYLVLSVSWCELEKDCWSRKVWREAATQVFFALGLGFGGVIAFSSYNKRENNCHFDAALVSVINFVTSILATLVVFAVLGFKANIMNEKCVVDNAEKIIGFLNTDVKEDIFDQLGLDSCLLEDELNKAVQGTGLAFIAFTEAMTHFPASPFWSVMFFFMLINLGLGSMIGNHDRHQPRPYWMLSRSAKRSCVWLAHGSTALIGSCRTWRTCLVSGRTLSITTCGSTFSPAILVLLIIATVIEMAISPAGYNAWVEAEGAEQFHSYPPWALAMAYSLIVVAMLPLPIVFLLRHYNLISDGSNKLSVSYRKGMMKDISNLEEQDEQRFILGKNPSEAPSPMPAPRPYLGPGGTQEMTNTNYGTSTKTGYQNIGSPESEL